MDVCTSGDFPLVTQSEREDTNKPARKVIESHGVGGQPKLLECYWEPLSFLYRPVGQDLNRDMSWFA